MRVERKIGRRSGGTRLERGCSTLALIVAVGTLLFTAVGLLAPELPGLVLQSVGFQEIGETDAVFAEATPVPTAAIQMAEAPPSIIVDLGDLGRQRFSGTSENYDVRVGMESSDLRTLRATFTEDNLLALCQRFSDVCGPDGDGVRNARVDLRPGGALVSGEVFVEDIGIWQTVGAVLQTDGTAVNLVGIDVDGTLYALPSGDLGDTVRQAQATLNTAIANLSVQAAGGVFRLSEVVTTETTLTLLLR